jgi:predicted permease
MYGGEIKLINLFKNPVIIATIFGLFFNYFNFHLPQLFQEPLLMLSQVSIPLILFSLGVRLASIKFSHIKIGIIGAILCPLSGILMAFFAIWIFDYTSLQKSLLILFGAMPPAVVNSLMAEKYGYDSASVASIVAIGNIFSLIIIPIVLFYLI